MAIFTQFDSFNKCVFPSHRTSWAIQENNTCTNRETRTSSFLNQSERYFHQASVQLTEWLNNLLSSSTSSVDWMTEQFTRTLAPNTLNLHAASRSETRLTSPLMSKSECYFSSDNSSVISRNNLRESVHPAYLTYLLLHAEHQEFFHFQMLTSSDSSNNWVNLVSECH